MIRSPAFRRFVSEEHIKNILEGDRTPMFDNRGNPLPGILGRVGACGFTAEGVEFGADLIEMQPGSAFPPHAHPGDHILYVIAGSVRVHVDGQEHTLREGETIYIPADYPHGVLSHPDESRPAQILAVGHPHKHIAAEDRMTEVAPDYRS